MSDPLLHPQFARELREELAKVSTFLDKNYHMIVEILRRIDPDFPHHEKKDLDEWFVESYDIYLDVEKKISEHFPLPDQDSMYHLIVSLHAQSEIYSRLLTRALTRLKKFDPELPGEQFD